MKSLFTAALLLMVSICHAQLNPCEHAVSPVMSLSAGAPYNMYAEGGILGLGGRVGLSAGVKLFMQTAAPAKQNQQTADKQNPQTSELIEPYARISYRISNEETSSFRHYLTAWYGINGMRGVSYRLGVILSETTMLAVEPNYSRESGKGVNFTLIARFN